MRCSGDGRPRLRRGWGRGGRWLARVLGLLILADAGRAAVAEAWTKVASPHFTILTPAEPATARAWALELEQFRRGLQAIVPVDTAKLRPVTVVLFASERAMEPYLPLENGQPARLGGHFVRADEINTIMLSLGPKEETRHTVFHEAVHWHLSAFDGPMPLWLGEGLAELYATFELTDANTYTFGTPIEHYVALLRREPFMPLVRLFGIGRESLLYNEGTRTSIFYAQSWALVHYIFYGEGSPGGETMMRYLRLLPTARSADEAFEAAFGASYGAVEKRLVEYIRRGSYRKYSYKRATDDIAKLLQTTRAEPGDLEVAQGSLLIGAQKLEQAEAYLRRAVALAPQDPRGWELLGHIAVGRKDYVTAAEVLTKAADAGSKNHLVYHNLAVTHMPPPAVPGLPFAAFDPGEMDKAAANYRIAIRLAPAYVGSYEGLAGLMHGMQTFAPRDLELLARGLRLSPGNAIIETGIAAGEIRAGRVAEGRARLEQLVAGRGEERERGLDFARDVLAKETLKAEKEEVDALARESRYEEALAVVNRALRRELELVDRQSLEATRRRLEGRRTIVAAVEQANRGDVAAARQNLNALLEREPERALRDDAERVLRELEKIETWLRERENRQSQPRE